MIQYPWLSIMYNQILQSYFFNRGHHAVVVYGSQDYGEHTLIENVARWLICTDKQELQYCGVCHNCILMHEKCHPDYYQLDVTCDTQVIGVDVVKNCIDVICSSTQCSFVKVVFIKNLEYLTKQAVNMLLKTIEEPPINTFFFLSTRNYIKIPTTLLSRCIKWVVLPPTESEGLAWLKNKQKTIDILSAQTALRLSNQSPIEAEFMFRFSYWKNRIELCKMINDVIINKNFLELLPLLFNNKQKYDLKPLFWLISILIDALKWQQKVNKEFLINLDQLNLIEKISKRWDILSLNDQAKQWLIVFNYFQKMNNINYELLLVCRLLNWSMGIVEPYL